MVSVPEVAPETSEQGWRNADALRSGLHAQTADEVRDILTGVVLSECIYKRPDSDVAQKLAEFKAEFPPGLVVFQKCQLSLAAVPHRYLLAEGPGALYVAFIGTKVLRDLVADVNIFQSPLWEAAPELAALPREERRARSREVPHLHRGFLQRARAIPIMHLYAEARRRKKRLVLCGHSLGGAVAAASAVRLLLALEGAPGERKGTTAADDALRLVKVVGLAQPPIGDASLRQLLVTKGWDKIFRSMDIPEDVIPRLLPQPKPRKPSDVQEESPFEKAARRVQTIVPLLRGAQRASAAEAVAEAQAAADAERAMAEQQAMQEHQEDGEPGDRAVGGPGEPAPEVRRAGDGAAAEEVPSTSGGGGPEGWWAHPAVQAAAGGARRVAQAAQQAMPTGIQLPSIPLYVPFGRRWDLLHSGVVPKHDGPTADNAASWKDMLEELRGQFERHKMRSYRERVRAMSRRTLGLPLEVGDMQGVAPIAFSHIAPPVGPLHAAVAFVPLEGAPVRAGEPLMLGSERGGQAAGRGRGAVRVEIVGEGLGMASRVRAAACADGKSFPGALERHPGGLLADPAHHPSRGALLRLLASLLAGAPPRARSRLRARVELPHDLLPSWGLPHTRAGSEDLATVTASSDFEESEEVPLLLALRTVRLVGEPGLPPGSLASLAAALSVSLDEKGAVPGAPQPPRGPLGQLRQLGGGGGGAGALVAPWVCGDGGSGQAVGRGVRFVWGADDGAAAVAVAAAPPLPPLLAASARDLAARQRQLGEAGEGNPALAAGSALVQWGLAMVRPRAEGGGAPQAMAEQQPAAAPPPQPDVAAATAASAGPPGPAARGPAQRLSAAAVALAAAPLLRLREVAVAFARAPLRLVAADHSADPAAPVARPRPHAVVVLAPLDVPSPSLYRGGAPGFARPPPLRPPPAPADAPPGVPVVYAFLPAEPLTDLGEALLAATEARRGLPPHHAAVLLHTSPAPAAGPPQPPLDGADAGEDAGAAEAAAAAGDGAAVAAPPAAESPVRAPGAPFFGVGGLLGAPRRALLANLSPRPHGGGGGGVGAAGPLRGGAAWDVEEAFGAWDGARGGADPAGVEALRAAVRRVLAEREEEDLRQLAHSVEERPWQEIKWRLQSARRHVAHALSAQRHRAALFLQNRMPPIGLLPMPPDDLLPPAAPVPQQQPPPPAASGPANDALGAIRRAAQQAAAAAGSAAASTATQTHSAGAQLAQTMGRGLSGLFPGQKRAGGAAGTDDTEGRGASIGVFPAVPGDSHPESSAAEAGGAAENGRRSSVSAPVGSGGGPAPAAGGGGPGRKDGNA